MWTRRLVVGATIVGCTSTSQQVGPGPAFAPAPVIEPVGPAAPVQPAAVVRVQAKPVMTVTLRVRSELASWPGALAWSPGGDRLVVGDDTGAAWILDASTGKPVEQLGRLAHRVTAIAASEAHVVVAASTELRVWEPRAGAAGGELAGRELPGHEDLILDLGFVGEALLAVDLRNALRRWDLRRGLAVSTPVPTIHALSLAIAPGGDALAIGGYGDVALIELPGGAPRFKLEMPRCSEAPTDLLCAEWRAVETKEFPLEAGGSPSFYTTERPNWYISDLGFSADGTRLAFGRADGVAVVVDAMTGQAIARFAAGLDKRAAVALTRDGGTLAIGDRDGWIAVWDVASRREIRVTHAPGEVVGSLAFSPDDTALAAGGPGRCVTIWALGR